MPGVEFDMFVRGELLPDEEEEEGGGCRDDERVVVAGEEGLSFELMRGGGG